MGVTSKKAISCLHRNSSLLQPLLRLQSTQARPRKLPDDRAEHVDAQVPHELLLRKAEEEKVPEIEQRVNRANDAEAHDRMPAAVAHRASARVQRAGTIATL